MAFSFTDQPAVDSQVVYTFSFEDGFLAEETIFVYFFNETTSEWDVQDSALWELNSLSSIEFYTAPYEVGVVEQIRIRREEDKTKTYSQFDSGGDYDRETIWKSFRTNLHLVHEVLDGFVGDGSAIGQEIEDLNDRLTILEDEFPSAEADRAEAAALKAAASAVESAASAAAALVSKDKSQKWAEEVEDVEVEPGKFSSLHHAAKAAESVAGYIPVDTLKVFKTLDYSILITDLGDIIELSSLSIASRTFTLPSVGVSEDRLIITISNNSGYNLLIKVSGADYIWNSGSGYGIELPNNGSIVTLRYNHAETKWDIIRNVGKVLIEGLVLYNPMNELSVWQTGSPTNSGVPDLTGRHLGTGYGALQTLSENNAKFPAGAYNFNGSTGYCKYQDSYDWDIFNTLIGHRTISLWIRFTDIGASSTETLITHYQDSSNRFYLQKETDDNLDFRIQVGGVTKISLLNAGGISDETWHHVAIIVNGTDVGLYIDGVIKVFDDGWDDTLLDATGSLYVGQNGAATNYVKGRMQDLFMCYNNPYNALPDVGLTDTFTVPAAPFQGVIAA